MFLYIDWHCTGAPYKLFTFHWVFGQLMSTMKPTRALHLAQYRVFRFQLLGFSSRGPPFLLDSMNLSNTTKSSNYQKKVSTVD